MAPGATTLTSLLLLLMAMAARCSSTKSILASTQSPFAKILKGVRLPGGYMEVVQEDHCSQGAVRLTCRSLKAFIFILEAEYLANLTHICGYDAQKLMAKKMYKNRGNSLSLKKKELKGNYIDDAEDEQRFGVVDIRQSLNRRCSGQKHCRYNFITDHPGAVYWNPATLRLKYACIPGGKGWATPSTPYNRYQPPPGVGILRSVHPSVGKWGKDTLGRIMVARVTFEIDKWTETDADVDQRPYAGGSIVVSCLCNEQ
ncbi:hypothetical protein K0M31_016617 [Melipona bicolor]|uniref:Uncharacterized protein n=1 Tax=Melipona bicolor TaxID=60889 RepID=A0AA40KEN9_9HYME|nr:hypothetical protein K0M31_016617 [Melipona bicolor]